MHLAPCLSKSCVGEFWALRRVGSRDEANAELTNKKVLVKPPGSSTSVDVVVPCAKNFRQLKAGDEVVLYKPVLATAPKANPPVMVRVDGSDPKKAKVS